ncbi:hypothetical protein POPTR_014G116332v4 [Populus trichocarpa]|uniref:Uncharacterized protein n=1 Tax=Populus trichocarpa TaxID=3694 RepID=A0ACC0RYL4_POPTR|nr:hypothetical protein POPTR_014G116332v4 [Populus trichocarpa]
MYMTDTFSSYAPEYSPSLWPFGVKRLKSNRKACH